MNIIRLIFVFSVLDLFISVDGLLVSTYNLWNHMFSWNVRKIRIREMIHEMNSDIVALQEVRSGLNHETHNQLQELKAGLTSEFKWHIFRAANNVSFVEDSIHKDYPGEGLGLLSKIEVMDSRVLYLLPSRSDPDKNKRLFIHITIKDTNNRIYNVINVHLSYYRQQQCKQVEEIKTYIKNRHLTNVILLGDFNTYADFEGPIQMLLQPGQVRNDNPCFTSISKPLMLLHDGLYFKDVWAAARMKEPGYTFSNMPSPGLQSRPDRILISSNLKVHSVHLNGDGTRYKQGFTASLHWERFCTIIHSSYLAYQGITGYSCHHDCGPQGSCRCGVCVAIGNKDGCQIPDCEQCNRDVFRSLIIHCFVFAIVLFHLSYAIVVIFVIAGGSYGETVYAILGCNCCLMNPKLFTNSTRIYWRRYRILRVCNCWPLFRLPPYVQLLVSLIGMLALYIWTRAAFAAQLSLVYQELPEELFPSDHLMLTAEIGMRPKGRELDPPPDPSL